MIRLPSRFGRFVLASAALHVLALLLMTQVDWSPLPPQPEPLRVRVIPLDPSVSARPAPATPQEPASRPPAPRPAPPERGREARAAQPRATPAPRPTPAPRATPAPPSSRLPQGQVVDLPDRPRPNERTQPPEDTPFLSDRNRVVERQTRAPATPAAPDRAPGAPGAPQGTRDTGPMEPPRGARPRAEAETPAPRVEAPAPTPAPPQTYSAEPTGPAPSPARREAGAQPSPPPAAQVPQPRPGGDGQPAGPQTPPQPARPGNGQTQMARVEPTRPAAPARPGVPPERPAETPRDALPAGSPGATSRGRTSADPNRREGNDGDGNAQRRTLPGLDRLLPGPGDLARVTPNEAGRRGAGGQGGGRVSDYLPGIEEGEETFLNSREFRYAYYFRHVRNAIVPHWAPVAAVERAYGQSLTTLPAESTSTVAFVIEKDGRISDVQLAQRSGVQALDGEAVRAIRAAGQLPAPPAGLLDADGRVVIGFGFTLSTGGSRITFGQPNPNDLRDLFRRPRLR